MRTFLKKSLILTILSLTMAMAWGQTTSVKPSIRLAIGAVTPTSMALSWITPPRAVACNIEYKTIYSTIVYPITNFSNNSITIPRATPPGPHEDVKISFILINGNIWIHTGRYDDVIGGMVVIEEDIFSPITINSCQNPGIVDVEKFVFDLPDICVGVEPQTICNLNIDYNLINLINPGTDYHAFVKNELQLKADDPYNEDVLPCGQFRKAKTPLASTATHTVAPNPFHDRLILKSLNNAEYQGQATEVIIRNIHGKIVYTRSHTSGDILIETNTWASGIYTISMITGDNKQVKKLMKY